MQLKTINGTQKYLATNIMHKLEPDIFWIRLSYQGKGSKEIINPAFIRTKLHSIIFD